MRPTVAALARNGHHALVVRAGCQLAHCPRRPPAIADAIGHAHQHGRGCGGARAVVELRIAPRFRSPPSRVLNRTAESFRSPLERKRRMGGHDGHARRAWFALVTTPRCRSPRRRRRSLCHPRLYQKSALLIPSASGSKVVEPSFFSALSRSDQRRCSRKGDDFSHAISPRHVASVHAIRRAHRTEHHHADDAQAQHQRGCGAPCGC